MKLSYELELVEDFQMKTVTKAAEKEICRSDKLRLVQNEPSCSGK